MTKMLTVEMNLYETYPDDTDLDKVAAELFDSAGDEFCGRFNIHTSVSDVEEKEDL